MNVCNKKQTCVYCQHFHCRQFDDDLLASINNAIITAQNTDPQAEDKYRLTLALSMVFKFFIRIREVQVRI